MNKHANIPSFSLNDPAHHDAPAGANPADALAATAFAETVFQPSSLEFSPPYDQSGMKEQSASGLKDTDLDLAL